jgi:hypothetical protein
MSDDTGAKGTIAEPVLKPEELFQLLVACAKAKYPVLVTGSPGIGKTDIVKQVAAYLSCSLQISHAVVDSPIDWKGQPYAWLVDDPSCDSMSDPGVGTPVANGAASAPQKRPQYPKAAFIPYGDLENLIHAKSLMIHFADDLGQASDMVKAAYMQVQLGRRINGHKISDHVVFFAATNRKQDAAGVTRFLEPLKDRYHTIVELQTDFQQWVKWAQTHDIAHEVWTWIRMQPQYLNDFKPSSDFSRTPTPRGIHQLSDMYKLNLAKEIRLRTFGGIIGETAAVSFLTHLEYYAKLEDPDFVIQNPTKARIEQEPALLYTLCGSLSGRASKKTIGNIVKYADRLEEAGFEEFSMLLVKDSGMKDPNSIMATPPFIDWASRHNEQIAL